jgi:NAD(P)H-flavin reductase
MSSAQGKGFPVEAERGKDLLLFAMGSGISAIHSLIGYLMTYRQDFGAITLFYGARTPQHFAYEDEVATWEHHGIRVVRTISRPDQGNGWPGATGYVQNHLTKDHVSPGRCAVFICGTKGMSEGIAAQLGRLGINDQVLLTNF